MADMCQSCVMPMKKIRAAVEPKRMAEKPVNSVRFVIKMVRLLGPILQSNRCRNFV